MTPRGPSPEVLHHTLARHFGAVRRILVLRHALRATAIAAIGIALAVALGMVLPLAPGTAWLRLLIVIGVSLAGLGMALANFRRSTPAFDEYLENIEQRFPDVRSWLRNALDFESSTPEHGSRELVTAVSKETAERLATVPLQTTHPHVEPRRPTLMILGALAAMVLLGVASPTRVTRSWQTLWNPALAAPPVQLIVQPGSVEVTPGAALAVRARVWGTHRAPRLEREHADAGAASPEGRTEDGARIWRFDLSQLTRQERYKVKVAHVESPNYTISLAGEPQPLSFTFEYEAPPYARIPAQRGASTRGDVSALRGSRARVEVTFDRDLESLQATLPGETSAAWQAVTPRRWRGEVPVVRDGEYELHATAASGEGRFRYRVNPMGDAPPILTVVTPETDLDLPAGQQVPLEVVGQDDLGLSELRLQFRKDPDDAWSSLTLSRFDGGPREARVATRWDASQLGLLPGDVATFRFELFDGNAVTGRGRAVSPTFELRFPSMAELYTQIDRKQSNVQEALERVADRAEELQKSLDKLARQPSKPAPQTAKSFERAEEMKKALERQQELAKEIDRASEELHESLEQAAERKAFNEELARKMRELNELMNQIQSQELREAMRRMQQALDNLEPEQLERNLPKWQEENKAMLEQLDRSIELLKQLREEERMEALARRAEELKERQDALNEEHAANEPKKNDGDSKDGKKSDAEENDGAKDRSEQNTSQDGKLAERQERAADESERLAEDVRELQESLSDESERDAMEQAAEALEKEAAEAQRSAAEQSRQKQSQRAQQAGQKASQQLQKASEQLSQMAQERQQQRDGVDLAAVRRAAKDLVSLQRSAEENLEARGDEPRRADQQTDLSEGVARVADSLFTLSQRTPFITPRLSQALGRAMGDLSGSGRDLASGNRRRGEMLGRQGAESLTEAILELRNAEDAMCNKEGQGGSQSQGSSAQRLGEVGEQQSQLNRETRSTAQRLTQQLQMSAGDRAELRRLAQQQERLRQQLQEIQQDEQKEQKLLGKLDAAEREMEEVAETIREGSNLGELQEKQQRILSRLLDAQRSVHRRDFDPERESHTADEVEQASPPELPADMMKQTDRLRMDLLKAESDRYPAQYRAFIEAYLRSLNGSRP